MSKDKPDIPNEKIRKVLSLFGSQKTYDDIEDIVPNRTNISRIKKWYNSINWSEAKAFAEGDEAVLRARSDYYKQKGQETDDSQKQKPLAVDLQALQIQHMTQLQDYAAMIIDIIPDMPPKYDNYKTVAQVWKLHEPLYWAFERLTSYALWPSLSCHLGKEAQEIENMRDFLEPSMFNGPCMHDTTFAEYKELVKKDWFHLLNAMLWVVNNATQDSWADSELNSTCPLCPTRHSI